LTGEENPQALGITSIGCYDAKNCTGKLELSLLAVTITHDATRS
jgi:hypothetical protein